MEMIEEPVNERASLKLTEWAELSLLTSTKWAKFLAIAGFIGCGLMLLLGIFAGTLFSTLASLDDSYRPNPYKGISGIAMGIYYAIFAVLYFFPCLYLYRFAEKARIALRSRDENILAASMEEQKKMYQFVGILTIITLSILALCILGVIFVASIAAAGS